MVRLLAILLLVLGSSATLATQPLVLDYRIQGGAELTLNLRNDIVAERAIDEDIDLVRYLMATGRLPHVDVQRHSRTLVIEGDAPLVVQTLIDRGYRWSDERAKGAHRLELEPARLADIHDVQLERGIVQLQHRLRECDSWTVERAMDDRIRLLAHRSPTTHDYECLHAATSI